jgi:thioredoxin-related protein
MQKVVPLVLLLWMVLHMSTMPARKTGDFWQSWQEVKKNSLHNNQPIFIDMYTDWCRYCKVMDATTYRNDSVIDYLRKHYQRFKFNAETKDTIEWRDKLYTFNKRFDVHDFAVYLTRGSIVYPTTIIISPGGQPYYKHGELSPSELEIMLKFFAQPRPDSLSLETFSKSFQTTWK